MTTLVWARSRAATKAASISSRAKRAAHEAGEINVVSGHELQCAPHVLGRVSRRPEQRDFPVVDFVDVDRNNCRVSWHSGEEAGLVLRVPPAISPPLPATGRPRQR